MGWTGSGKNWVLLWWAEISKTLIWLSSDGWGYAPFLVVIWPEATQPWNLQALWWVSGGFQEGSHKGLLPALLLPVPCPCGKPLLTHISAGDHPTLPRRSGSIFCGVTSPFPWVLVHAIFCLCPPRVKSLFLPVPWKWNPSGLQNHNSGGFSVPLLDPHAGKPDAGLRTFTTVRELLMLLFSSLWVTHLAGMGLGFIMIVSFLPSCCSFFFVFARGVSFLVCCSILLLMSVQS